MGLRAVGLLDHRQPIGEAGPRDRGETSKSLDSIVDFARKGEVDTVFIALPTSRCAEEIDTLIEALGDTTASVYLLQDRRLSRLPWQSRVDELPQFINVWLGSMSIVGPRPHAVSHNEHYRKRVGGYMLRHKVKPGITGLAQINGWRGETDTIEKMAKRVELDLDYNRNGSFWLDLTIVARTLTSGFSGKNVF
jgi:hypothetical protein